MQILGMRERFNHKFILNFDMSVISVDCGPGTFFNPTNGSCIDCPAGTFQNFNNQKTCKPCVSGTTSSVQSKSQTDCNCKLCLPLVIFDDSADDLMKEMLLFFRNYAIIWQEALYYYPALSIYCLSIRVGYHLQH